MYKYKLFNLKKEYCLFFSCKRICDNLSASINVSLNFVQKISKDKNNT